MQIIKPVIFTEAVDKLGSKSIIGSKLNSEQWAALPQALRDRGLWSAQIESIRFLQRSRGHLSDYLQGAREEITLPNGTKTTALKTGGRADFIKKMQDFAIKEGMGPLDPAHAGTIKDIRTERRLGLIFDTQVRMAQDYGNWKQGMDPDVLNAYPAQRFIRVRPVKESRDTHHLHENEVQLKTDLGFWKALNQDFGNPYGPWGWGCGHDVEDVDRSEAERRGLVVPGQNIQPVEKQFNDDLEASARGLDPDMRTHLQESFGDQVVIEGDTARWRKDEPKPQRHPKPAPDPVEIPAPVRSDPVSKKVSVEVLGKYVAPVQNVLQQIDKVHDDGKLNPIPINHSVKRGTEGTYYGGGTSIGLRRRDATHPEMTIAHEVGHWIDDKGLPGIGFSSPSHPELADWRQAVQNSQAFQNLKSKSDYASLPKYRSYILEWVELWARAYAQFITTKSGDKVMRSQLQSVLDGSAKFWVDSQWTDEDFQPILFEIEKLFKKMHWL